MKTKLLARRRRYGMEAHIADGRQRHFLARGQEFGGGALLGFCASLFRSLHCFPFTAIISDQGRTRGFSTFVCACGGGLAFSGSAFGIACLGVFVAPGHSRAQSSGSRFILARVGPHRSINTA